MAFRLYIVPIVGTGTDADSRRPKYLTVQDGLMTIDYVAESWAAQAFGLEPWMIVGASLSVSNDNFLVGQADVFALPLDLSVVLTPTQVTSVKNKLEAINVPAGWVTTALTWLSVVRTVLGMFSFMQRYEATGPGPLFGSGVTLATTFGSLPPAVRTALLATAQSFALDTANLTGATTLRVILKALADQFSDKRYTIAGVSL